MKPKLSIIFAAFCLFSPILAQQEATCEFRMILVMETLTYTCGLTIVAPQTGEVERITGEHMLTRTDEHVRGVVATNDGPRLAFFPSLICARFPNLQRISFVFQEIEELSAASLAECSNLEQLSLHLNQIAVIDASSFAATRSLVFLHLGSNRVTAFHEDTFAGLSSLKHLVLGPSDRLFASPFTDGLLRDLVNLETLNLRSLGIRELDAQWFAPMFDLQTLHLGRNFLGDVRAEYFATLTSLMTLSLDDVGMLSLADGVFAGMTRLQRLDLSWNRLASLTADAFVGLGSLRELTLAFNDLVSLEGRTFHRLRQLTTLDLRHNRVRALQPEAFAGLESLRSLDLTGNAVEALPAGIFAPCARLQSLAMATNRVQRIPRDAFGASLASLENLNLDLNRVDAVERSVVEDASALTRLLFWNNTCASVSAFDFQANRDVHMHALERCFRNFAMTDGIVTDGGGEYLMLPAPPKSRGIELRVRAVGEIQLALAPFEFAQRLVLEIFVGAANNTRTVVRRNQLVDVAAARTPGIIDTAEGGLSEFVVTWAHDVVLVRRFVDDLPFIGYTMSEPFAVNYLGLRTPDSRAVWTLGPLP